MPFTLSQERFPDGPLNFDQLLSTPLYDIAKIPKTKENILQLAHFLDPITAYDLRSNLAISGEVSRSHLADTGTRMDYFRNWPSCLVSAIAPVLENYKVVTQNYRAKVYIPAVYFVDEESGNAYRSGPFLVQPSSSPIILEYGRQPSTPSCGILVSTRHPHVSENRLCLGDESSAYQSTRVSGDCLTPVMIIEQVLQVYNPESPYFHFNAQFPAKIETPQIETHVELTLSPVYSEASVKVVGGPPPKRLPRSFGPISLVLSDEEFESFNKATSDHFYHLFKTIQHAEASPSSDWHKIALAILPEGNLFRSRLESAGVNITPAFNSSDVLMNAIYTPLDRSHCFDTSTIEDLLENPDDPSEAEDRPADEDPDGDEYGSEEDDEEIDEDEEDDQD